ncbi:MAG: penicillin-binding protein, partial [Alistipes sp.]|nr:penicillin-binding protein [Alistipes sp.]
IMRASLVAMDPRSGHVKAYVGGPNFRYFKYDMAKQGKRQIGSTVKPFIYTFAIDQLGLNPCAMAPNLPVSIETPAGIWSPKEAGNVEYDGVLHPLYWGLANSRNNYSAWIMKQAKQPETVADFLHNMGIRSYIYPAYALCLGAFESNVFELVSTYSTFVNEGVHIDPIFVTRIEDRQGNLISSFIPQSQDAVNKHTAYTMLTMLQRVITAGTGGRLAWQFGMENMDIGGKTGTSNENRDAWFMCVTPTLVAGSWVGGEDQSVHLRAQGEGSVMALPIVGEFLKRSYDDPRLGLSRSAKFSRPEGWVAYDCPKEMMPEEGVTQQQTEPDEFFD